MGNLAGLWPALQSIGVVGLLVVALVAVSRGAYIPRSSHQELLTAQLLIIERLAKDNDRLQAQIERLESALAARSGDDD